MNDLFPQADQILLNKKPQTQDQPSTRIPPNHNKKIFLFCFPNALDMNSKMTASPLHLLSNSQVVLQPKNPPVKYLNRSGFPARPYYLGREKTAIRNSLNQQPEERKFPINPSNEFEEGMNDTTINIKDSVINDLEANDSDVSVHDNTNFRKILEQKLGLDSLPDHKVLTAEANQHSKLTLQIGKTGAMRLHRFRLFEESKSCMNISKKPVVVKLNEQRMINESQLINEGILAHVSAESDVKPLQSSPFLINKNPETLAKTDSLPLIDTNILRIIASPKHPKNIRNKRIVSNSFHLSNPEITTQIPPSWNNSTKLKGSASVDSLPKPTSEKRVYTPPKIDLKNCKLKKPKVTAKAWVIFDVITGRMLCGHNERESREVASLTKILTCLCVIDFIQKNQIHPSEEFIRVSGVAAKIIGTSAQLRAGDTISLWDLIIGMMLPSGNDAAYTLAEYIGKKLYLQELPAVPEQTQRVKRKIPMRRFIRELNKIGKDIGLRQSYFATPHGLYHQNSHSNAYDMGKLSQFAMQNTKFREIVAIQTYTCTVKNTEGIRKLTWQNTNRLLSEGYEGIKTGMTRTGGSCLSSFFQRGQEAIICVVLGCSFLDSRFSECKALTKFGFELLKLAPPT